jgi:polysaccharide export outer membrane protein
MFHINRFVLLFYAVFIVLFFVSSAYAQEQEYRIGPRDVISVNVFAGDEKQISEDVTVAADGMITLPLLGEVQTGGLTLGELKKNSIEPLALKYFVDPQVVVAVKEYHSLTFYISGSVKKPGHYELDKEPTMLELIAKAGGMVPKHGYKAYVMRESHDNKADSGKPIVLDLKPLLNYGDMTNNLKLATGDVIHIPMESDLDQTSNSIFVEGEVKRPGVYPFQQGITALSACILAGGFNDYAAPNRAKIIRGRGTEQEEVIEINLDSVKKGKAKDIQLTAGDLVHIPDSWL